MKTKDLAILVLVGAFSVVAGLILGSLVVDDTPLSHQVDSMKDIPVAFPEVDESVFSDDTIDTFSDILTSPTNSDDN